MSPNASVILGIDPGTAITGYGVVSEAEGGPRALAYGVIRTPAKQELALRLVTIYAEINTLLDKHQPDAVAVEEVFFSKNARTALSVGHARGVVLLAVAQRDIPLFHYKPTQVKQAVTGYGGADKRQIQEMMKMLLGLDDIPRPDDAADALAIALCHLNSAWAY